jgi:hypothetical protein
MYILKFIYTSMRYLKKFKSYNSKEISNESLSFIQETIKKWSSDDTFWSKSVNGRSVSFSETVDFIYKDKGYDDDDFENIIEILERDCSDFLSEISSYKDIELLFRGSSTADDVDNGIWQKYSNINRRPKDTSSDISNIFNDYFLEKFGTKVRAVGVFASKNAATASDYGDPYIFFPKGKYKYYWSYEIDDLYSHVEGKNWYYRNYNDLSYNWESVFGENNEGEWCYDGVCYNSDIISSSEDAKLDNEELNNMSIDSIKKLLYWKPGVELDEYINNIKEDSEDEIKSIVSRYQEGGLDDIATQEITFKCDDYYLVDIAFYNKIIKYLNN